MNPRIQRTELRKLRDIDAAMSLNDLLIPPSNRLETVKGSTTGQYSIRINDHWRICCSRTDRAAEKAKIVDYH
ncbi:MAG: type II toxin-antitoxin system RelE/ParE family toxin [Ancrocorticia sp.]|nr:type II toxin-antitoxin system RelE/ParE family toxin [Ancrocorticia sp.]MCI2192686.1 type II toxin-antitoxin system RelE/ParE family toxin [Ancrocorticia sp.]